MATACRHGKADRGRLARAAPRARSRRTGGRLVEAVSRCWGRTTVTEGVEPPAVRAGCSPLDALEQRVLRRRGRHDLQPLQFSTDTGDVTVSLVEHLQAYLDSTPISGRVEEPQDVNDRSHPPFGAALVTSQLGGVAL